MHTFAFDDGAFDEGVDPDRALLGGKGAGLVEMTGHGLPVPPGFVIATAVGRDYLATGALPAGLDVEVNERIAHLERLSGHQFGNDADPLLVSVRSGAPVSMPGMMDTVLNVGLTEAGADALADQTGDPLFGWRCLEVLIDQFARTVRGIKAGVIEEALMDLPREADAVAACRARAGGLIRLIDSQSEMPFPGPQGQLLESIDAVFRSWQSPRAAAYRRMKGIDEQMGTAVVIQTMVFGNRGRDSGSGVAFTRDPSTGAAGVYGDFLFDAQGEDVVSGEHDTLPLVEVGQRLPEVGRQLEAALEALEGQARDLCDVEFTVEQGRLWILQTRVGQRSGRAAVRIAVALVDEGVISQEEATARVTEEQVQAARSPIFAHEADPDALLARGTPASPGAAVGRAVFDAEWAQRWHDEGQDVVLVRPTTSPMDLPGVIASCAVVTGLGGRTSHAAVVARGMDRPAVCGIGELVIGPDGATAVIGGETIRRGDTLAVDGDRGIVAVGDQPLADAANDETLARFLAWRDAAPTTT